MMECDPNIAIQAIPAHMIGQVEIVLNILFVPLQEFPVKQAVVSGGAGGGEYAEPVAKCPGVFDETAH